MKIFMRLFYVVEDILIFTYAKMILQRKSQCKKYLKGRAKNASR